MDNEFHPPLSKQLLHGLNWHQQQANGNKRNKKVPNIVTKPPFQQIS
jgi:hypothetical protein